MTILKKVERENVLLCPGCQIDTQPDLYETQSMCKTNLNRLCAVGL